MLRASVRFLQVSKGKAQAIWRRDEDYQYSRFPGDQFSLIRATTQYVRAHSSLEVGSNAGLLVHRIQLDGKFSVGIEALVPRKPVGAILTGFRLTEENIPALPIFDIVLLLSVHHQWVAELGDEVARQRVVALLAKANLAMYVEFAALNSKYGYRRNERFLCNDPGSVQDYARTWLIECGFDPGSIVYLGAAREYPPVEPERFIFMVLAPSQL